ncbi:MAG: sensor domain-containing protein, partial [Ilumatobacteraceae bacterium]
IPMLVGIWYLTRALANVERRTANVLLGRQLATAPMASPDRGNLWVRLRSMTNDRTRRRELGYLLLRFPAGIATFTMAVTALTTPIMVSYAPFAARYDHSHPFGNSSISSTISDVASSSPWSWLFVPAGLAMLIGAFHLLNSVTKACGRWTTKWLDVDQIAP